MDFTKCKLASGMVYCSIVDFTEKEAPEYFNAYFRKRVHN